VSNLCDYCKARLAAGAEHRVPKPKREGSATPARPETRGESYWLVHDRCVALAIEHLRFDAAHR
jgi:hypothetical protein